MTSVEPVWGTNYWWGFSGFSFTDNSFISKGIAWFTRPDSLDPNQVPVSHAFTVSGPDGCIEAIDRGVVHGTLEERFNDPHTHVFFREPVGHDFAMGNDILSAVERHVGEHYDFTLILADLLANTVLGRVTNSLTHNQPNTVLSEALDQPLGEICSELVARGLQSIPSLAHMGCLKLPARMITPRMLAFDQFCYKPLVGAA